MKKFLFFLVVFVLLFPVSVGATSKFGPNPKGNNTFSLGIDYTNYGMEWEDKSDSSNTFESEQNQAALSVSYSPSEEKFEVYSAIGGADLNVKNALEMPDGNQNFEGKYKIFSTLGMKVGLCQKDIYSLGAFVQGSMYAPYEDEASYRESGVFSGANYTYSYKEKIKVKNQWDAIVGLTGEVRALKNVSLYGGPFFRMARVKAEVTDAWEYSYNYSGYTGGASGEDSGTFSFKEKNIFGGFVGMEVGIAGGFAVNGEAQFSSEPSWNIGLVKYF